MIRRYSFLLALMLLSNVVLRAQSIKFSDLTNIATLNNDNAYATLKQFGTFKQEYSQNVDGYDMEYFKNANGKPNTERIATGRYTKLYNGTILRTLTYTSTDVQNVLNMVSQAKYYGMEMQFNGEDHVNNIYLFSNSFFFVRIYIRRDQASGLVEIKQRDYLDID